MQNVINNCSEKMKKSVASLQADYAQLRTGRASAALFDKLKVDYYGAETPLSQVASISVPEARMVVIQPWDKTVLPAIEKAIQKSELGLNPNNDGKLIRVNFPALTADRRKELAKQAKATAEQSRVAVRNIRRDAMEELKKMKKSVASLQADYAQLRTGRASAALFDKIKVEYYGAETPLSQAASISVPEARMVVIQPWDKTVLPAIEKAIQKSELGLNPNNDGKLIRVNFPALTADRRKELAKQAKATAEQARVAVRNIRRDAMEELKKMQKNGEISEDQQKDGETKIQKLTDSAIADINKVAEAKEKEIMEI